MALSRVLVLAATGLALASPSWGQTADPDRARVLLDSAATALGMDAFGRVDVLDLRSEGVSPWTGQGASPADPTRYRRFERRTVVDLRNSRFHQRNVSRYPDGAASSCSSSRARGEEGFQYDCFSRVSSEASPGASAEALISSWRLTRPFCWIESARQVAEEIEMSKGADGGTKLAFELGGVERVLHIRPRTYLPARVEWTGRDPLGRSVTRVLEYEDYRDLGGFRFPFHMVYRNPGGSEWDLRYREVHVDLPVADSLFDPPSDARRADRTADRPEGPRVNRLAEGVYRIQEIVPGYNTMFVDTGDGVAVFDAPGGPDAARRTLEMIESELPQSPVRWVILTHFHHDHVAGLRPFVERGATVLTTGGNVEFIHELLESDWERDAGSRVGTPPSVETVRARRTIGRESRRVVVYAVDGRPHVDEMLIPYVPERRTMYVADLFWKGATGHVRPADRETIAFAEILSELRVEPERLVLAHGESATIEELESALHLEPGVR
ncbi:MAG: MBL fold metallo-hydrolase [Gemmatimonadota bacterium]